MDGTPKLQRKSSLSLSARLKKRHSASPKSKHTKVVDISNDQNSNTESVQCSPSVKSICSDGGIECTPPHKGSALNLDESLDYSPKMFDTSFSPNCLSSQTLAIDSPEVSWKWSRYSDKRVDLKCGIDTNSIRTPDSAYAADSSFASAGSSSTEVAGNESVRGNFCKLRSSNEVRKIDQRKILEQELRRVENIRAEEMLKQRCERLQEQLKSAGTLKIKTSSESKEESSKNDVVISNSSNSVEMKTQLTTQSVSTVTKFQTPECADNTELLNDFFNDSDMDFFLVQATQEIESKIESKTQPARESVSSESVYSESSVKPHVSTFPATTITPPPNKNEVPIRKETCMNSANKDKRSSFYMKFLEDDCPDDWFVSLDEVILQATQNKKPRSSLQRYKSMPTETAGNSKSFLNQRDKNDNCLASKKTPPEETATSSSALPKMKRHSSTHALSPIVNHYRSRRQL